MTNASTGKLRNPEDPMTRTVDAVNSVTRKRCAMCSARPNGAFMHALRKLVVVWSCKLLSEPLKVEVFRSRGLPMTVFNGSMAGRDHRRASANADCDK